MGDIVISATEVRYNEPSDNSYNNDHISFQSSTLKSTNPHHPQFFDTTELESTSRWWKISFQHTAKHLFKQMCQTLQLSPHYTKVILYSVHSSFFLVAACSSLWFHYNKISFLIFTFSLFLFESGTHVRCVQICLLTYKCTNTKERRN